jgi:diguanylate cyclase (GGDEF)-like protein
MEEAARLLVNRLHLVLLADACVLVLEHAPNDWRVAGAVGTNVTYFAGAKAQLGEPEGTMATLQSGRGYAGRYLARDLSYNKTDEPWTLLRSQMIVPVTVGAHQRIGTLHLYKEAEDAFSDASLQDLLPIGLEIGESFKKLQDRLFRTTDPVTGLGTLPFLEHYIEREWEVAVTDKSSLSLLLMDIDNLTPLLDRWGGTEVNRLLQVISQTLQGLVRDRDIVTRYHEQGFALLLTHTDIDEVQRVRERVLESVQEKSAGVLPVNLDISFGNVTYPDQVQDAPALLRHAEKALYDDKNRQRSRLRRAA